MRKTERIILAILLLSTLATSTLQKEVYFGDEEEEGDGGPPLDHDQSASAVLHGHTMTEEDFYQELKKTESEFYDVQLAKATFTEQNPTLKREAYSELLHKYLNSVFNNVKDQEEGEGEDVFQHVGEQMKVMVDEYLEELYGDNITGSNKQEFGVEEYVHDIVTGGFVSWVEQAHMNEERENGDDDDDDDFLTEDL